MGEVPLQAMELTPELPGTKIPEAQDYGRFLGGCMPVVLGGSQGVGRFLMGEVPLQAMELTPELPGTKINYIDLGAGRVYPQS
jgi:hypothetical protein